MSLPRVTSGFLALLFLPLLEAHGSGNEGQERAEAPSPSPALDSIVPTLVGDIPFTAVVIDSNNPPNPWCKAIGDLDGDGFPDLLVASAQGGGLHWYAYPNWTKSRIADGSFSNDMQVGDVDGDSDLDVIALTASGLAWYRNPRPGSPPTAPWTGTLIDPGGAHDLEVGDLNNDGRLDVVTRGMSSGRTYVWLQSSTGSFTRITASADSGEGTGLGDIDRDGDLDILHNGFWLENTSGGTSWLRHDIDLNWPIRVGALVADINEDGRNDVVLAPSESSNGRLSWYESPTPRSGPWTEHSIDTTVSYLHTFKAGDVDKDGDLDLVTAEMHQSGDPDEVSVYLNEAGSGLAWRQQVVDTVGSHNLRIADIGLDGDLDIYGANWNDAAPDSAVIRLWRNELNSRASLDSWQRRVIDADMLVKSIFVTSADLNRDGKQDIVAGKWWYQNPGSTTGSWTRRALGAPLNNLATVLDFDFDGDLDVLGTQGLGETSNHNFAWGRNDGAGNFTLLTNINTGGYGDFLQGVAAARYSRGSPMEVALSWHNDGGGVQMLTVPPSPSVTPWSWRTLSTTTQKEQLSAGDIDRDGDLDLLLGTRWLRNNGSSWTPFDVFTPYGIPDRNRLADINRDGRLDAVIGYEAISVPGRLAWYAQPSSPTALWAENVISTSVIGPMSVDVADMDGDGDLDVVAGEHNRSNPSSARLFVFENANTVGTSWRSHLIHTGDEHHDGAQVVDIDGDGDLDILSIGWDHHRVLLYENRATSANCVPTSGLQLWLKGDVGVERNGSTVSRWLDQSGNARHATQANATNQPTYLSADINGRPALRFDGINDFLTFNLPVNSLTGMTLFLVSAATGDPSGGSVHAQNAALFWNETTSWGTVYLSPFQTRVQWRFGTTQTGNWPTYVRPSSIGSAYTLTASRKNGSVDSLYLNGTLVQSEGGKLPAIAGCRDTGNLGRGYNDNTYFPGKIAEVLVYNRALTDSERATVESCLRARYGL